jgi:hypothetical protein
MTILLNRVRFNQYRGNPKKPTVAYVAAKLFHDLPTVQCAEFIAEVQERHQDAKPRYVGGLWRQFTGCAIQFHEDLLIERVLHTSTKNQLANANAKIATLQLELDKNQQLAYEDPAIDVLPSKPAKKLWPW